MAFKKFRKMKVYNVSGYNYKDTPTIILKGDWLKETGFDIGSLREISIFMEKVDSHLQETLVFVIMACRRGQILPSFFVKN